MHCSNCLQFAGRGLDGHAMSAIGTLLPQIDQHGINQSEIDYREDCIPTSYELQSIWGLCKLQQAERRRYFWIQWGRYTLFLRDSIEISWYISTSEWTVERDEISSIFTKKRVSVHLDTEQHQLCLATKMLYLIPKVSRLGRIVFF